MGTSRDQRLCHDATDDGDGRTDVSRHGGPTPGRSGAAAGLAADLAVSHRRRSRLRRDLERAEMLFVARVVRDGGMEGWRSHAEGCILAARRRSSGRRMSRTETAALVVALADGQVRDRFWLQTEADPDFAWISLWIHLARHALPPFRVEPLFLLAWSAWRTGDVTLARAAVDLALAEEPGHGAAGSLDLILRAAVDPDRLPSLAAVRGAGRDAS